MSKDVMSKIRASDVWKAIERVLVEYRISRPDYIVEDQRPHPKLTITYLGQTRVMHFAGTSSSRQAPRQTAAKLRRLLREMQLAAIGSPPPRKHETERALSLATEPAPSPTQPLAETKAVTGTTVEPESSIGIALRVIDEEPRILDTDLAERLGFERHRTIREIIDRNASELINYGGLPRGTANPGPLGGRPSYAYYLNEEQALLICMLSRTDKAKAVRAEVIRVFTAWRRGQLPAATPPDWDRALGMIKMLAHKVTETEHAVAALLARKERDDLVPAYDLAGTVTALDIIEMSGVPSDQRVRGTSPLVTKHMKVFCLRHGYRAEQTPKMIDADTRWRFPREAASAWLLGEDQGVEVIRGQVARQRARSGAGQLSLVLNTERRP